MMIGKSVSIGAGKRQIESGRQYEHLFSAPVKSDPIIHRDGDVDDTLRLMGKIASQHSYQVQKLAKQLKGSNTEETCRNVWDFVYKNIQYTNDKDGVEQLRTPSRTWADRKSGVDCDCMSIFISACLRELGINHRFRVVSFSPGDFEHVYVVVPRNGSSLSGGQYILDGVIHQFDKEKTFYKAQDFNMQGNKVQMLNGIPIQVLNGVGKVGSTYSAEEINELNKKLLLFLQAQYDYVSQSPSLVTGINPQQAAENLLYVIKNWNNPHNRVTAVQYLAEKEAQFNPEKTLFRSIMAFFDGELACDQVCAAGYVQLPSSVIEEIKDHHGISGVTNSKYGDPVKMIPAGHKINKIALAMQRGAFLTLVRMNVFNMADKIAASFFPANICGENYDGQWFSERTGDDRSKFPNYNYAGKYSAAFGYTTVEHLNARRNLYDKILRRWNNLGGDWDDLKKAAIKGAHKLLNRAKPLPGFKYWCLYDDRNLQAAAGTSPTSIDPTFTLSGTEEVQLGEAATVTAIITSATTIIVALMSFLQETKKPGNAITDQTVSNIPSNPTTNPDPTNHPDAQINPATGLWYSGKSGQTYDPATGKWTSQDNTGSLKKIGLITGGLILGALGLYYALGDDKKSKQSEK